MIYPLLPIKLSKTDSSYKSVENLYDALIEAFDKQNISNIALTGPFGSGKSSVLQTLIDVLIEKKDDRFQFLNISLATLQTDDEIKGDDENVKQQKGNEDENQEKKTRRIENLNRRIEYSILQQIIYKEKVDVVPNSRFRKIIHLSKNQLTKYCLGCIGFVIAFFVAFEPKYAKIDTINDFFNFGSWNLFFDIIFTLYMLFVIYKVLRYVIKSYCNSKLNKLNLKDGEIEVIENNSIFNRHLDEILYFFQVTKYNVVIIEDLDRFDTPNIFLKLRELNLLINESKIVGRHIVFVYAVKDDIFLNEDRTKFFDYIETVIPVINPSNSKDKLKNALKERGCAEDEISDDDLSEIAFFIQDMRILINIANEYCQYKDKLCNINKQNINLTKLLAMIVYKNYHPNDFSLLHRREGRVYQCFSGKKVLIEIAQKELDNRKSELQKKRDNYISTCHLRENELRILFIDKIRRLYGEKVKSFKIDKIHYNLQQIADDKQLFKKFVSQSNTECLLNNGPSDILSIPFKSIDKELCYSERIVTFETGFETQLIKEEQCLKQDTNKLNSLRIKDLIEVYQVGELELYNEIGLSPLMDVFIRRGYIDEDYYDYISYFYEGMISPSDRDLLLSIKTEKLVRYDYHIDEISNFINQLKPYMFDNDAILNIELLDYLCSGTDPKCKSFFESILKRLERTGMPLKFLYQYYLEGKMQNDVFCHIMKWDKDEMWQELQEYQDLEEKELLLEAWLKYSENLNFNQQSWLNENFEFLVNHSENMDLDRCLKLISASKFIRLTDGQTDLLDCAIEYDCYVINQNNLFIITNYLCSDSEILISDLNYTRLCATQNPGFIKYARNNISNAINYFEDAQKDESEESMIFIINDDSIDKNIKEKYLKGQLNQINDIEQIKDKSLLTMAIVLNLIKPSWCNITSYYKYVDSITQELIAYLHHNVDVLSKEIYPNLLKEKSKIFLNLFGNTNLDLEAYKSLIDSFDNIFDGENELKKLDKKYLQILLDKGRIIFNEKNLVIINQTDFLSNYLIHYSDSFMQHLDFHYLWTDKVVISLLSSSVFNIKDKRRIIEEIPCNILVGSQQLANILLDIMLTSGDLLDSSVLLKILKNASNDSIENKIRLTSCILKKFDNHSIDIKSLMECLGDEYSQLLNSSKRPTLTKMEINKELLDALKKNNYIGAPAIFRG